MMNALDVKGKDIFDEATRKVNAKGLPQPKQPLVEDPEFQFPADPNNITSVEIGQWLYKFTGYFNHATRLIGLVESELVGLDAEYKLQIHSRSMDVRGQTSGRPNADVVEALVLRDNPSLEPLYSRRLELQTIKAQLEARIRIYEKGYQAMSRELARRDMEAKL